MLLGGSVCAAPVAPHSAQRRGLPTAAGPGRALLPCAAAARSPGLRVRSYRRYRTVYEARILSQRAPHVPRPQSGPGAPGFPHSPELRRTAHASPAMSTATPISLHLAVPRAGGLCSPTIAHFEGPPKTYSYNHPLDKRTPPKGQQGSERAPEKQYYNKTRAPEKQ